MANLGKSGVSVGYYDTEEDAAKAYDRAAIGLYTSPMKLNFPEELYDGQEVCVVVCAHTACAWSPHRFPACTTWHVRRSRRCSSRSVLGCVNGDMHT